MDRLNPARLRADDPGPKDCCNDTPTPIDPTACDKPTDNPAGCEYYRARHDDFVRRHECCEPPIKEPPEYYLKYGWHYCDKFTTKTYQWLSPQGQAWLGKVRCKLQQAMERELVRRPGLELDGKDFRRFALKSHDAAYREAGLFDLPWTDPFKIVATIELDDWMEEDVRQQARSMGLAVGGDWIDDVLYWTDEQAEAVKKWLEEWLE